MNSLPKKQTKETSSTQALQTKIEALQKQLEREKLRADALDTMINVAEKELNIVIRKKAGTQLSKK